MSGLYYHISVVAPDESYHYFRLKSQHPFPSLIGTWFKMYLESGEAEDCFTLSVYNYRDDLGSGTYYMNMELDGQGKGDSIEHPRAAEIISRLREVGWETDFPTYY